MSSRLAGASRLDNLICGIMSQKEFEFLHFRHARIRVKLNAHVVVFNKQPVDV
jgi:hypothetical protein